MSTADLVAFLRARLPLDDHARQRATELLAGQRRDYAEAAGEPR